MKKKMKNEKVFRVPSYTVKKVVLSLSETVGWGQRYLNIPSLWKSTEGEGVRVAVLDTGIADHPDLAGAIIGAKDFTGSRYGVSDQQGHGTHCAGIVAARKNHNGIVGVAPKAQLLIGKVLGDDGYGTGQDIAAGINWAVQSKAKIISMSLGSQVELPIVHKAIKNAIKEGVFIICASGNDDLAYVDYPGAYVETVAVGSINRNIELSSFSSIGDEVTVVAPGEDIVSTYPPNTYATLSGTSMATPFVAGVVALMLAKHKKYGGDTPITNSAELKQHLANVAIDLGKNGFDPRYGWGLINPKSLLDIQDS